MKEGRIRSLEEIFLHSMPIKEHQIVDHFFPPVRSQCPLINSTPSTRLSSHATHRSVSQTAGKLKDEVMTIKPVQKQSSAGQRTRFKAYVAVGDFDGHIGLGKSRIRCRNQKRLKRRRRRALTVRFHAECSSEVATAIRGALIMAKMHLVPIRRGYWGKNSGLPHTVKKRRPKRGACAGGVRRGRCAHNFPHRFP